MTQTKAYEPNILVDTSDLPRDEWLKYRRLGIGGSDSAAILGISPFRTARDLYYDKLNIVTADDEGNWVAMEMGNLLEPLVARIFAKKTGLKVFQRKCMFQHPHYHSTLKILKKPIYLQQPKPRQEPYPNTILLKKATS